MAGNKVGHSMRLKGPTTNRVQRHELEPAEVRLVLEPTALQPVAPVPTGPPRSLGDFSRAPAAEIVDVVGKHFGGIVCNGQRVSFRRGMRELLAHLEKFDGETWQERWQTAGLNERDNPIGDVAGDDRALRKRLTTAAAQAFAMRLIRPSLFGFRSYKFVRFSTWFRRIADDPLLEELCARSERLPVGEGRQAKARSQLFAALTVYGIDLADLTPEGLLHYAVECRDHGLAFEDIASRTFAGTLAWTILRDMGHFPDSVPRTLRGAVTRGQLTVEEAVDRYRLHNQAVRDLLVEYIRQRAVALDYSSRCNLVRVLAKLFWKTIEEVNPEQVDLRLSEETVRHWKERLKILPNGKPRIDVDATLLAVRALYLDLHTWSVAAPERWGAWAAPNPIRDEDLRWFQQRRSKMQERTARRTRDRQPLLPILSQHVNDQWQRYRVLLNAAKDVAPGEEFTAEGTTWLRVSPSRHSRGQLIRAVNRTTGDLVRLSVLEIRAFWQWAAVETLRLAGLRAEELAELTHLSVRQYQRTSGEVVALLVISPSKSDRERVIPMSAELFHVIAQIIRRHRSEHGTVPICQRYDRHERVWSEDLPYLFQTVQGGTQRAMSATTIAKLVRQAANDLIPQHPEFADVKFSPQDFRRLFATELVNNGLPIHIGAALLGHLNIQTTRGYVAVFAEDVITQYQQFLARRRGRPSGE